MILVIFPKLNFDNWKNKYLLFITPRNILEYLLLIEKNLYENSDYDPDIHAALKELKRRARKEKD